MSNWAVMLTRWRILGAWLTLAAGCGPPAPPPPGPLPGVATGDEEWFWRDVLAAPLPGEAPPAPLPGELLARIDALAALAPARNPAALATLMAALRDESDALACAAAHDLGAFGFRAAIPRLIKGLGPYPVDYDVPLSVRVAQASALARLGHPAGVPLLLAVLAEGTDLQQPEALLAWPRTERMAFAQELALEGLVALAGTDFGFHPSASVPGREAAVRRAQGWWEDRRAPLWAATAPLANPALVSRVRMIVAHLGAFQLRQVDGARFTLAELGPGVLPFLREGLAAENDYVRLHCLQVMARLAKRCDAKTRGRIAILASAPLLGDTQAVAVEAAAAAGAAGVVDPLVVALERRREPAVLLAVVDALGLTGLPTARDALTALAASGAAAEGDLAVALEAALLASDPARSLDAFLELLASEDPTLAYAALQRLIRLTGTDCGLDPQLPPAERAGALSAARAALQQARTARP